MIYARLSVSREQSVSIARQVEACTKYAEARGMTVVGTFTDDGVSATRNKPEERKGWRDLMASPTAFDVVVVWKVDRLARRVLDFLNADHALQERKAGLVAVEDPIDMTTAQGRAFATMLAVFGQLEADAISARVRDARAYLLRKGRWPGGSLPYGYRAVPNPDGDGWVVAKHPDQQPVLEQIIERTMAGRTLYSTMRWLNDSKVPTKRGADRWSYHTINLLVRNPILAGLTLANPGNLGKARGGDFLRDERGLPLVNPDLAVMSLERWRAMQARLDAPNGDNRKMPRHLRNSTSGALSGLVFCGEHLDVDGEPTRMWRATVQGRPGFTCKVCHQTISAFEELVIEDFLATRGSQTRWSVVELVTEGGAALLPEITRRLGELSAELVSAKGERVAQILDQMNGLKQMQAEAEAMPTTVESVPTRGTQDFAQDWAEATDDETRREILGDAIERIWVIRGKQGGWTPESKRARLVYEWKVEPQVDWDS